MQNLERIKFINTTYVYNINKNSNYHKEDNLLVGTINAYSQNFKLYKSLLRVNKSDLKFDSNKRIYLFLFIDNMYVNHGNTISFSIVGNDDDLNIAEVNWLNFPKRNSHPQVDANVSVKSINKYIKIDITSIIKSLTSRTNAYNLIIQANRSNSPCIIQFDSCNGENIPYLAVVTNPAEDSTISVKANNFKPNNNYIRDYYTRIMNEINNQNLRLDSFEKNLTTIFSSLETKISNIQNDESNNVISDLNQLTKNEILQLKNSVNYDIIQLKNFIESKITNIKDDDTYLNDKIVDAHSQITQNFSNVNNNITSLKDSIESLRNESDPISQSFLINSLNNLASDLNELTRDGILELKDSVNYNITELKNSIDNNVSNLTDSIETKIADIKNDGTDLNYKFTSTFNQATKNFSDVSNSITSLKDSIEVIRNESNSISESFLTNFLNDLSSDLNQLTKNEILQLKNSVNHDIIDLRDSIKDLNDQLLQLSNQINKISSVMQNVLLEPIDN